MTKKISIKVIGYGRTSSEDKGEEKVSVDAQKEAYLKACADNGWINQGWFEDRDFSGRTYPVDSPVEQYDTATSQYIASKPTNKKHRKGLSEALRTSTAKGCAYLWVRDVTRFARPVSGSLLGQYLRSTLQASNCQLWSGTEGLIDYTKLETRIVRGLQDELEDHAIKTKIGQSKASIRAKRDSGLIYRNPDMFGFRSSGHGKLSPVESELSTVKMIYQLFNSGLGLNAISRKLNSDNVPTMAKGNWAFNSVRKVLNRPLYAGYQTDSKGNLVESPIYSPLAVVSVEDYRKAQSILSGQSRPKWQSKFVHPLQGLLYCGYCGHQMGTISSRDFSTKEPTYYYRCDWSTYQTKEQAGECRKTMIRETLGTPATINQKKGYLSQEGNSAYGTGLIESLYPFVIPGYIASLKAKASQGGLEAIKEALQETLSTIKAKQVQRYTDKENGLVDDDTYVTLSKSLMTEKAQAEKELKELEKQINEVSGFQMTCDDLDSLKGITATEYSQLIRQVINKVLVFADKIEINLKGDTTITLARIQDRNSRLCPKSKIFIPVDLTDSETLENDDKQISIQFLYKSAFQGIDDNTEFSKLHMTENWSVLTVGNNNPSKSTIKKRALLAKIAKAS